MLGLLACSGDAAVSAGSDTIQRPRTRTSGQQRASKATQRRFAEDFNREIQNAYFNFQLPGKCLARAKLESEFNERYKFWREKTAYPQLIGDFYFTETGANQTLLRYPDKDKGEFAPGRLELKKLNTPEAEIFR